MPPPYKYRVEGKNNPFMNKDLLHQLCTLHSTSEAEEEVFVCMQQCFEKHGFDVVSNNYYVAGRKHLSDDLPTLLLAAHADSPGWAIADSRATHSEEFLSYPIRSIGDISSRLDADAILKAGDTKIEGKLTNGSFHVKHEALKGVTIREDDRICFRPKFQLAGNILEATFLDNRIGCFMLAKVAETFSEWEMKYNLVLAVSSSEETTGDGANKLAEDIDADIVIVLDTTYEEKDVLLGNGAVLTLKDDGLQLDDKIATKIIELITGNGIKIQTESTYGYTDTVSFVDSSNASLIISLLIAQKNNHSFFEQIDIRDIDSYFDALKTLCCTPMNMK